MAKAAIKKQRGTTPPLVRGGSGGRNSGPGVQRTMHASGFGAGPKGSPLNVGSGRLSGRRGGGEKVNVLGGRK